MDIYNNKIDLPENRSGAGSALLVLFFALFGSFVGSFLGLLLAIPFYPGSFTELSQAIQTPLQHPEVKLPLFLSQGVATGLGMIFFPYLYVKIREERALKIFFDRSVSVLPLVLTFFIVLAFMPVNALFIDWNAHIHFPEFLSGFENWAREKEDSLALLTEFLTQFDHPYEFAVAFLVIAIIAPIGEELLFRGCLQNYLFLSSRNVHVAIWVTALIFSTFHLQFFGFIPRLLLGALFGYLYYWSGNLWVPIIAHLANNGFTLVLVLFKQGQTNAEVLENTNSVPLPTVLIFAIITTVLIYYFRNIFLKQKS